jgi:hypothetical protein
VDGRRFQRGDGGMTPTFRQRLATLGLTQTQFARLLAELGDPRPATTILRCVQELARPCRTAPTPWAVVALLGAVERMER